MTGGSSRPKRSTLDHIREHARVTENEKRAHKCCRKIGRSANHQAIVPLVVPDLIFTLDITLILSATAQTRKAWNLNKHEQSHHSWLSKRRSTAARASSRDGRARRAEESNNCFTESTLKKTYRRRANARAQKLKVDAMRHGAVPLATSTAGASSSSERRHNCTVTESAHASHTC